MTVHTGHGDKVNIHVLRNHSCVQNC